MTSRDPGRARVEVQAATKQHGRPEVGSPLFTDLYEFTMLEAYHALGMTGSAVFSLFVRELPPNRNYLVACGIGDLLAQIESFRFFEDDLAYLNLLGTFSKDFLEWLGSFRFTGDIYAMPEGGPVFAQEPILEVIAPIGEAQLIETLVINQIGFQTLIASKAVRIVEAARGRRIIDFGSRRAHGMDAAVKGARAAYIAGVAGTSNVEAGKLYAIPVAGTVAHSFVQAFSSEMEAFRKFARHFPDTTLLVDTYDTLAGVEAVIALAEELGAEFRIRAIRLDSGNLLELSLGARQLLDAAGLTHVQILASGALNEDKIGNLVRAGAPIDAFGVGTDLSVSSDAPALDIAYKLTEYAGLGRMKLSAGKRSLPGRKQVYRRFEGGIAVGDTVGRFGERCPGHPLLEAVMKGGHRVGTPAALDDIRARTARMIAELPQALQSLEAASPPYPVELSLGLLAYDREIYRFITRQGACGGRK
jgi:nicotinate phosphoribosyltransferase